ncbi:inner-membrane translocator [Streptomyces sp. NPDC091281]|uniref:inner-membrane translocator n=1 Tax=Streptomyces sp. NPDC091281 TaxID=3365985 RepID=UPI0037F8594D
MPELDDKQSSGSERALTAGCLLFLVLVADAAAALLVAIVLAVRGLNRMHSSSGQAVPGAQPVDWASVLGFGALALLVGVIAVVLLRTGPQFVGAVQLIVCVFLTFHTLEFWL